MDLSQMSNAGSKYASETTHLIGSLISTAVLITDRLLVQVRPRSSSKSQRTKDRD